MEKIKNYLQNKSIGYFMAAADALLALVLAIIFFATYKGAIPVSSKISSSEIIGIFALAGMAVEIIALVLPEYRFIHLIALAMYCVSLGKEIAILANMNSLKGANVGLNITWLIFSLIIIGIAIAVAFLGFYKKQEEADADFKDVKSKKKVAKMAGGAVLLVATVLSASVVSLNLPKVKDPEPDVPVTPEEYWNPITDEVKKAAAEVKYDFDPASVLIKQQKEYDYKAQALVDLKYSETREGHNLVYYFEGSYAEGYQGDYSERYTDIYLWDDGLYVGKSRDTIIKGYWYNSSLAYGSDEDTGKDIIDCLNMVSNITRYESIITQSSFGGFYEKQANIYLDMGWGQRSMIINGYKYYPNVALAVKTNLKSTKFKVGETIDFSTWEVYRVDKNLKYTQVVKKNEIKTTIPSPIQKVLNTPGEYEVLYEWKGLKTTVKVVVEA